MIKSGFRVSIIGWGASGLAAARLLKRAGASVFVSEGGRFKTPVPAGVASESGGHTKRVLEADLIVRSPGVPQSLPVLRQAAQKRIPIWSELELAFRYTKKASELIAITGTNGKTTTTTLVGRFFQAARRSTIVAGNIGTPLSEVAHRVHNASVVVLEVSSYQLENIETFHPTISAILNITPDHLEHHGSMQAYAAAKARVFENQTQDDVCVFNADDAWCRRLSKQCRARTFFFSRTKALTEGIYYKHGQVVLHWRGKRARWRLQTPLMGPHNIENILAAVAMAVVGGVSLSVIRKVLKTFRGVEHRLEWVRTLKGVRYVNDSKGTNVDSTRVALASFEEPLIVIMGGEGKGAPYAPLRPLVRKKAKRLLLIGEDAKTIRKELGNLVPTDLVQAMGKAVLRARQTAQPGDVVLLSPACASFDQYNNYEERGRHFKTLVRRLK